MSTEFEGVTFVLRIKDRPRQLSGSRLLIAFAFNFLTRHSPVKYPRLSVEQSFQAYLQMMDQKMFGGPGLQAGDQIEVLMLNRQGQPGPVLRSGIVGQPASAQAITEEQSVEWELQQLGLV